MASPRRDRQRANRARGAAEPVTMQVMVEARREVERRPGWRDRWARFVLHRFG